MYFGFKKNDIIDIIRYYDRTGEIPVYIKFDDREKYDIKSLAQELYDKNLGGEKFSEYVKKAWEGEKIQWKALFGFDNMKYFTNEVTLAWKKIMFPEMYAISHNTPLITYEKQDYKDKTLEQIRAIDPNYYEFLRDSVFNKHIDKDGYYHSAKTSFRSQNKMLFHIDHIIPMKKGGKTELSNLQLLHRKENWEKGAN